MSIHSVFDGGKQFNEIQSGVFEGRCYAAGLQVQVGPTWQLQTLEHTTGVSSGQVLEAAVKRKVTQLEKDRDKRLLTSTKYSASHQNTLRHHLCSMTMARLPAVRCYSWRACRSMFCVPWTWRESSSWTSSEHWVGYTISVWHTRVVPSMMSSSHCIQLWEDCKAKRHSLPQLQMWLSLYSTAVLLMNPVLGGEGRKRTMFAKHTYKTRLPVWAEHCSTSIHELL